MYTTDLPYILKRIELPRSETIFNKALDEEATDINDKTVNNIRHIDDTILKTSNLSDLQHLLEKLNNQCTEYWIKNKCPKKPNMWMVITKSPQDQMKLKIENVTL